MAAIFAERGFAGKSGRLRGNNLQSSPRRRQYRGKRRRARFGGVGRRRPRNTETET